MNAIEILKQDHKEVLEIFKKIEKSTSKSTKIRDKLIEKLYALITTHSKAEEKLVYPIGLNISKLENPTREAYEEHAAVDMLLKKILKTSSDDENFLAKCSVIKENLEHHIKEEENNIFPALEKKLSDVELEELAENLLEFKARFKLKKQKM